LSAAPAISRDKEKGWVVEDGKRLVTFRIRTFQSLVDRLTSLVGSHVAELGPVLDNVLANRGWGRCTDFEKQARDGKTIYTVRTRGSPFSHERTSATSTCHLVGGILSGYLEAYLGKKAQSYVERECESRGNQFCIFETTFTP
jgi:hypothetical protein